jgi:hypothetical protein
MRAGAVEKGTASQCYTASQDDRSPWRNTLATLLGTLLGLVRQLFLPASLSALSICASLCRLGQFTIVSCDRDQAFSLIWIGRV